MPHGPPRSRLASGFCKDESGATTIEVVIWLPIFVLIFCMIVDATMIFGKQAEVLRIVQDANRATSVGRFTDTQDTEAFIAARIAAISPHATVTTTADDGVIVSTVIMPASDLTATKFISAFTSLNVRVRSEQLSEA